MSKLPDRERSGGGVRNNREWDDRRRYCSSAAIRAHLRARTTVLCNDEKTINKSNYFLSGKTKIWKENDRLLTIQNGVCTIKCHSGVHDDRGKSSPNHLEDVLRRLRAVENISIDTYRVRRCSSFLINLQSPQRRVYPNKRNSFRDKTLGTDKLSVVNRLSGRNRWISKR